MRLFKKPKMFYRLQKLSKYFECGETYSKITILHKDKISTEFRFESKQGLVEIFLCNNDDKEYWLEYVTYAGVNLFTIYANSQTIEVEPCMGYDYNVKAKDIDLAIYELESYLQSEVDIDVVWDKYCLCEQLALQSHKQQLKELM